MSKIIGPARGARIVGMRCCCPAPLSRPRTLRRPPSRSSRRRPRRAGTVTTNAVSVAFRYNRTPGQTRRVTCRLSGPTAVHEARAPRRPPRRVERVGREAIPAWLTAGLHLQRDGSAQQREHLAVRHGTSRSTRPRRCTRCGRLLDEHQRPLPRRPGVHRPGRHDRRRLRRPHAVCRVAQRPRRRARLRHDDAVRRPVDVRPPPDAVPPRIARNRRMPAVRARHLPGRPDGHRAGPALDRPTDVVRSPGFQRGFHTHYCQPARGACSTSTTSPSRSRPRPGGQPAPADERLPAPRRGHPRRLVRAAGPARRGRAAGGAWSSPPRVRPERRQPDHRPSWPSRSANAPHRRPRRW